MASTASPPILPVSSIHPPVHPHYRPPFPPPAPASPLRHSASSSLAFPTRSAVPSNTAAHGTSSTIALRLLRPETLSDATSRVRKNYTYFRVNYLAFLAAVLIFSSFLTLSLLVLLSLLGSWCFFYLFRPSDSPLVILGRTFSNRETLFALLLTSFLVIFLTSVGSLLISAIMVGAAIICVHGAFRVPEDLFLDEQEPPGSASGFLSFLGNASAASGAVRV
ncbi:PRA1 family protein B1 [Platanthera zijinensis]|uniref:PRA1 family protein n=1 Tax=Platanthera zijinensis TaxID=2320716 RepID=A0AAP0BP19_9ASPA